MTPIELQIKTKRRTINQDIAKDYEESLIKTMRTDQPSHKCRLPNCCHESLCNQLYRFIKKKMHKNTQVIYIAFADIYGCDFTHRHKVKLNLYT